jgi:hypothetical protein
LTEGSQATPAEPEPQPEAADLYVFAKDEIEGPFSREQLQQLLQTNTIHSTPCCEGGAESWKTVADYIPAAT